MGKTRTYTIQQRAGVPCLTIQGKYLMKDFGIEAGTQLRLLEGKNMLILVKVPEAEVAHKRHQERLAICEQEAQQLRSLLNKGEVHHGTIA
jgi:hypothetical protein